MAFIRIWATPVNTSFNTIYTVPALKKFVGNIKAWSNQAWAVDVSMRVGGKSIMGTVTLDPREWFETSQIIAIAGDVIEVQTSVANVVDFTLGGEETDNI